ncbi:MAG: phenylacetate--CoA ligase family protein [Chloroflexota bacterium]
MERSVWNQAVEMMPREQMDALRTRRLRRQMSYCYRKSEFYRERFDRVGVRPGDIHSWQDIRKLPVLMTKDDERESDEESLRRFGHPFGMHICVPPQKIVSANATSGTTGTPTFSYTFTRRDLETLAESLCRMYWIAGLRPGDRLLNAFMVSGAGSAAGAVWTNPLKLMNILSLEVGAEAPLERLVRIATLTHPKALMCSPSFAESLAQRYLEAAGKPVSELGFKVLLFTGEPGIGIPAVRARMEQTYGGRWFEWTGHQGDAIAVSCEAPEYQGAHELAPEVAIYGEDLVDPVTKKPVEVKDGVIGEGVLTSLKREGTPYFKYAMGDVLQVFTSPCECGYPGVGCRKKIVGRVEDAMSVEGVTIFPTMVKDVVTSFMPRLSGSMRIVLTEKLPFIKPPLRLKVEHGRGLEPRQLKDLEGELKRRMKEKVGVVPEVEFLPPGALEVASWKTPVFEKLY